MWYKELKFNRRTTRRGGRWAKRTLAEYSKVQYSEPFNTWEEANREANQLLRAWGFNVQAIFNMSQYADLNGPGNIPRKKSRIEGYEEERKFLSREEENSKIKTWAYALTLDYLEKTYGNAGFYLWVEDLLIQENIPRERQA